MNYNDFRTAEQEARAIYGPGTLLCYISCETLTALANSALADGLTPDDIGLDDNIVFRMTDAPGVRFFKKEKLDGPYVD